MAKGKASRAPSPLEKKLASIRAKLLGNPSMKELQRLQIQSDLLESMLLAATNSHHHDTNEHHDHEYLVDPTKIEIDPAAAKAGRAGGG
jgi:hypothetical protein